jgi:glutathione S-transferase
MHTTATKQSSQTPRTTPQPELVLCEVGTTTEPDLETYSPFCLKVHRALRAVGLRYTSERRDAPQMWSDKNPVGQVPVLLVDGEAIADSTRILSRLDALSGGGLSPRDPRLAAENHLYEELADTALNGFVLAARWADDDNWPRLRDRFFAPCPPEHRAEVADPLRQGVIGALVGRDIWRAGPAACWQRFEALLDALDARAPEAGLWLDARSRAADCALFGQLWSLRSDLTPRQARAVERRERLTAYLGRVHEATKG